MKILLYAAVLLTLFAASYYTHLYVREKYTYLVFSVGGMTLSFLGVVAAFFGYGYIHTHPVVAVLLFSLGIAFYVFMFVHDYRRTSIWVAILALILRLAIVLVVVIILLLLASGNKKEDKIERKLEDIERELKR